MPSTSCIVAPSPVAAFFEQPIFQGQIGDDPVRGTERKTRPTTSPAVHVATPVFDGARIEEIKDALKRYYNDHRLTLAEYQAVSGLLKAMSEEVRRG